MILFFPRLLVSIQLFPHEKSYPLYINMCVRLMCALSFASIESLTMCFRSLSHTFRHTHDDTFHWKNYHSPAAAVGLLAAGFE